MSGAKSKEKGSEWERQTCRSLSLWLTGDGEKKELIRTVLSGGWNTQGQTKGMEEAWAQVGDLAPNGPRGRIFREHFGVECKHHKLIDLWGVFTAPRSEWRAWWAKLVLECLPHEIQPLIFMKMNNRPPLVGMTVELLQYVNWQGTPYLILPDGMALIRLTTFLESPPEDWFRWKKALTFSQSQAALTYSTGTLEKVTPASGSILPSQPLNAKPV
jgi:hypothetical protein